MFQIAQIGKKIGRNFLLKIAYKWKKLKVFQNTQIVKTYPGRQPHSSAPACLKYILITTFVPRVIIGGHFKLLQIYFVFRMIFCKSVISDSEIKNAFDLRPSRQI